MAFGKRERFPIIESRIGPRKFRTLECSEIVENIKTNRELNTVKFKSGKRIIRPNKQNIIPIRAPNIVRINDDNRPYVKVKVFENDIIGLLDSGANISVMGIGSEVIIKKCKLALEPDTTIVATADGKHHVTAGCVNVPVTYNETVKVVKFHVVPSLRHKMLFGCNFWNIFGLVPAICDINLVTEAKSEETEHDLTSEERERLREALKKFPEATDDKLGCQNLFQHTIDTGDHPPVTSKPYYYSAEVEKQLNKVIDRWLKLGIIEPSSSEWINPLVVVPKRDGEPRVCIDARKLNLITKKDKYPMPNINKILSRLKTSKYFCTFDLKEAFLQTKLEESAKEKTSFAVHGRGLFCFKRMPFGLVNSAAAQCRLMNMVLGYDLEPRVFHYLDDIIIAAETFTEMVELMEIVAERLKKAGLTINIKKSQVAAKTISYLGYKIDENGLSPSSDKITPILNYTTPKTVREVRRLVGMCSWYRRFIPNFADLITPITDLISKKNQKVKWNPQAESSFQSLKTALVSAPVLSPPDFDKEFTIQTDASDVGIAGILTQNDDEGNEHVVCYFSKKLTKSERKFTVTERECLAVLRSIEYFRPYVELRHFKVLTDHFSLLWLFNLKDPNGRLSRWALKIQQHDFEIQHRKGKLMVVPDALSRSIAQSSDEESDEDEVGEVASLDWYEKLKSDVEENPDKFPNFRIQDDCVMKHVGSSTDITRTNWRIVVPPSRRSEILNECHDKQAHLGYTKTYARVCEKYYWPKMFEDVRKYVRTCKDCGETKAPNYNMTTPMGQPRIPTLPFEVVSMDFKGPFLRSKDGFTHLLVITDHFSKYVIIKRMRSGKAKMTCQYVEEDLFHTFGVPRVIICDNGNTFVSKMFTQLLDNYKVKRQLTPYYHPQANPTERVNRVIGTAISAYVKDEHRRWDENVSRIACALRTCHHESTKHTPYEICFGMKMRTSGEDHAENVDIDYDTKIDHLSQVRKAVKKNLTKAYEKSRHYYNLRAKPRELKVNQSVYVRNFKLSSKPNDYSASTARDWKPGVISEKHGNRYKVKALNGRVIGIFDAKDIKAQ